LVELLVVLAVISILIGIGTGVMTGLKPNPVSTGEQMAGRLFASSRTLALNKQAPVRILVHQDTLEPDKIGRVLVRIWFDSANNRWQMSGSPIQLPTGAFFDPSQCPVTPGGSSPTGTMNVNLISGIQGTGTNWRYYEFASNGACISAGERFIISTGFADSGGTITFPDASKRGGFVLRSTGKPIFYQDPNQI